LAGSNRKSTRLADERALAKITRQIDQMVNAIAEGMFHPSMKDKMTALESFKSALTAKLRDASTVAPVLLHPGLADRYQAQVADLTAALQSDSTKDAASTSSSSIIFSEIRTEVSAVPAPLIMRISDG
jgi:site-specific DNA recombinase